MSASALLVAALVASQIQTHPTGLKTVGLSHGRGKVRTVQILDKLYEQAGKPSLDLDFARFKDLHDNATGETSLVTFSRSAASSPGTYVGADGLIKTAAVNLALYSEQFDNAAWTKSGGATVLANQEISPDGKQTADLISVPSSSAGVYRSVSGTLSGVSYTWSVYVKGSAGEIINVGANTSSGVLNIAYQQVSLTTSWQRVSGTLIGNGSNINFHFRSDYPIPAGVVGAFDVYAWGAQLEEGTVATPYIKTTSQALAAPRFDHDPVTGESLGLLVEEARSNLFLNSATLATQTVTTTAAAHTLSFYGTGTVDLTGTHTATVVGTGAYPARTTLTFTPTAGSLTATVTGTVEFAQLEAGGFPTSYIPTAGTSLSRAADVAAVQNEDFATTNLLAYSESFDVGWSPTAVSFTGGFTAPDGQSTAQKFITDAAASFGRISQTVSVVSGAAYSYSLYAKAAEHSVIKAVTNITGAFKEVAIDLTTGVVTPSSGVTGYSESVGNGWYRVTLMATSGLTSAQFQIVQSTTTGDGTSGIYLWGASLTATEYPVAYTTTRNLLTDSQDFERASWTKVGVTIGNDVTLAPDGTPTAEKLEAQRTVYDSTYSAITTVSGATYTLSVYAKADTYDKVSLEFRGSGSAPDAVFDLSSGTVFSGTGTIAGAGNGWYRCSITKAAVDTSELVIIGRGASGSIGDSIYLWGAQLEPGSTATDYVRTVDVVGKAYRWYEPTEGTVFAHASVAADVQANVAGFDFDANNTIAFGHRTGGYPTNNLVLWIRESGVSEVLRNLAISSYSDFKISPAWQYNNANFAADGTLATPDFVVKLPIPNQLTIGKYAASSQVFNGHIRRLTYWPVRHPDATLQVITQ